MIKLKDILLEAKQPQTKIFDRGALNDSIKQIQKMLFPHIDPEVEYTEYRFSDGTGGLPATALWRGISRLICCATVCPWFATEGCFPRST